MRPHIGIIIVTGMLWGAPHAGAQIARPDSIIHGRVLVDGKPLGVDSQLGVVARMDGFDEPVAAYRLGDMPAIEDRFVLHVPQAFELDGSTPGAAAPRTGQTVRIYVQPSGGSEVFAGKVALPASGQTVELNLGVSGEDLGIGRDLPGSLNGACGGGGGLCGAMGFVNFALMLCGLAAMKSKPQTSRRVR